MGSKCEKRKIVKNSKYPQFWVISCRFAIFFGSFRLVLARFGSFRVLVSTAHQFIKLKSFICLRYYLFTNLKIGQNRTFLGRPTNQKFWLHLSDILRGLCGPYGLLNVWCFILVLPRFFKKDFIIKDFVRYAWVSLCKGPTKVEGAVFYSLNLQIRSSIQIENIQLANI